MTTHRARLARIEAALVQTQGMLGCMQVTNAIPFGWQSQVEEKRRMLSDAVLDVIALQQASKPQREEVPV